jgi:hypothetical protein
MRPGKILILSPAEGKKEIQCVFRSWFGVESEAATFTVEYKKEEARVQLYSPQPDSVMTGRR